MAVNSSRSQRQSLLEGSTDGKYRKVRPDTEPVPTDTAHTMQDRTHLHAPMNYGFATQQIPLNQQALPGS